MNLLELSHNKFEGGEAGAKPGGAGYAYSKRIEIARKAKDQELKIFDFRDAIDLCEV